MGKQKRRNAFFYFMMAEKPEVEKRLKRKVMAKLVTAEWQALPKEQWRKYQLMTGESRERLECRGVPLWCLYEAAREEKHQAEEMKRDIADLVDMYRMGNGVCHRAASARKHSLETHKLLGESEEFGNSLEETAENLKQLLSK
ncbi:uncharacterized protein LOC126991458 isoform X7 [Eriocheir sinensis]|nr:uncharacterized protein LOC126991458 isoform X7 [Eriocheir sinensis]